MTAVTDPDSVLFYHLLTSERKETWSRQMTTDFRFFFGGIAAGLTMALYMALSLIG